MHHSRIMGPFFLDSVTLQTWRCVKMLDTAFIMPS